MGLARGSTFGVGTVPLRAIAEHLAELSPAAANYRRAVLSLMMKHAVAEGLAEENIVLKTLPRPEERERERLTVEWFEGIREAAAPWVRNAMDLALQTLQRRTDLTLMRFDEYENRVLPVVQSKTGACIKIHADDELDELIRRCRDEIPSPFIIHRLPERRLRKSERSDRRLHLTQVLPEELSRAFADARAACGLFADMAPARLPTFHEIRSLGADLIRKAGKDPQPLLGHRDRSMTDGYLEGHEHWIDVYVGLGDEA